MTGRRRKILGWLAASLAALVAILFAAQEFGPSWLHGTVERIASRKLGRDVSIAGRFDLSLSWTPRLTAGDVSLANAPWGTEPAMVRFRRLMVVVDLASLWSGPIHVRELELDGARLLLERDGDGHGNWALALAPGPPPETPQPPRLEVDRARIRGFELVYRPRPGDAPVTFGVEELSARLDPATRMVDVAGTGLFERAPWQIAGRIGTLENLRAGHDTDQDLVGHLGESKFEIRGRLREPFALGGPALDVALEGPDLAAALGQFGLSATLGAPFRLRGRLTPDENGVGIDAEGALGGVTLAARGVASSLTDPERLDVRVEATGADASEVGSWLGWSGLPPEAFELAGRLRRETGRLSLDDATLRVGATSLIAAGELGAPPRFVGTNLAVRSSGPDLAQLSSLTRLSLPSGPFELEGRLLRRAEGLAIEGAELRIRETRIRAAGTIGEPPRCLELDLAVEAEGPELALFSRLVKVDLPARPFEVRGGVVRDSAAFRLDHVAGRLDDVAVSAEGRLVPARRLAGSDVLLHVAGPDFARLAASFPEIGGSLPAEPFDLGGRLRVEPDGYSLEAAEISIGRLTASGNARLSAPSPRTRSSFAGRAGGAALSDLAAWGLPERLPAEPFTLEGTVRLDDGLYRADRVVATVGSDRAGVDGVLGALPDLTLLDAAFDASGPSVAGLARFAAAAGLTAPPRLPSGPYAATGRIRRVPAGYELRDVRAEAAGSTLTLNGTLSSEAELRGTDLRFAAEGPDTSLLAALAGTDVRAEPFEAHGQIHRVDTGFRSDGIALTIGAARANLSGTLGERPDLEGTELRIDVAGPDLAAALGPLTGRRELPAEPFAIALEIAGNSGRLVSKEFSARLGANDLSGRLAARLEGRRSFEADLRSRRLDVSRLLAEFGKESPTPELPAAADKRQHPERDRLLPDEPLKLAALREFDANLRFEAAEIVAPGPARRDVVLAGTLDRGALRIERFAGSGLLGGHTSASLEIVPLGDGYRLRTQGRLDDGRLVVSRSQGSPERAPQVDLEFELEGEGRSLHEIAASLNGHALVVVGPGEIHGVKGDESSSRAVREILDAITPLRETRDHADVECGVALVVIDGGKAEVLPLAVRTDRVTVSGLGRVDLETETIDLSWRVKERMGTGLSTGEMANSYVKLGGTLASPSLELKPLEALTSMGAAIATGGLTMVAKGLWNRMTHDKKVCESALEDAKRRLEKRRRGARP